HGTKCAGIIVGAESGVCGKGVAYNAQISGIRIYTNNRRSTDQSEALGLSFQRDIVDIYSNGWGPGDMGWQVKGPGPLLKEVLEKGAQLVSFMDHPKLTWRDVQHIIVRAAKPITSPNRETRWRRDKPSWNRNSAGLLVSSDFGFGLMDAKKMIEYAKKWRTVPRQLSCEAQLNATIFNSSRLVIPWRGDLRLTIPLKQEKCNIQYLEHMQAEVNLRFPRRGYLEMFSTSPGGTRSKLLYSRKIDILTRRKTLTDWRVTSLHYWGEKPFGNWNFTIRSARPWSNLGAGK
ncbi:unnamed protein product, partial [Porites evermanni]